MQGSRVVVLAGGTGGARLARGFAALDREAVRLPAFRVEEHAGLVWVCLSPGTEPLDERLRRGEQAELMNSRARFAIKSHSFATIDRH